MGFEDWGFLCGSIYSVFYILILISVSISKVM